MSSKNQQPVRDRTFVSIRRWLWGLAFGSLLISIGAGAAMTWVAWQHNPQQAYHSPDEIDVVSLLAIFGSWFTLVFVLCCVAFITFAATSWALWRLFVSRGRGRGRNEAE